MSDLEDQLMFQIRVAKLPTPEREVRFDPVRRWRLDFLFRDHNLGVEVDGGGWVYGRHNRPQGAQKDMEKGNALTLAGIRMLKFDAAMVADGRALATIEQALKQCPVSS